MLHQHFIIIPSITARLSMKVKYGLSSCGILFLFSSQPCIMWYFSCHRCSSWSVVCCISCIDQHSWLCIAVCTTSVHIFMLGISLSLLSWFCCYNQSAMNSSGLGMYSILILYWWISSSMHLSLCNSVAMSSWRLLLVIFTSMAKQ